MAKGAKKESGRKYLKTERIVFDENGEVVDNEDLHTLNIMKQYYQLDKVIDKDEMLKEITDVQNDLYSS